MQEKSVISRVATAASGVFAPGHLGELTQVVDCTLVDAVLAETGAVERRVRLLPARVVVYFVLALALFEDCGYRAVWGKLTAGLVGRGSSYPHSSSLSRARRRLGAGPLRALFESLAGAVAWRSTPGAHWRGMRTVAVDGTTLQVPDRARVTQCFPKHRSRLRETGYPLLRLVTLVETGTRAILAAAFGPDTTSEISYARQMLDNLGPRMLVLLDAGFDTWEFLRDVHDYGAQFLARSSARRCPTIQRRLPDGSYLARLGHGKLPVRIIEARITIILQDGTEQHEQWRLTTSLLDHAGFPAQELVTLYHERWQAETTYASLKATLLDGRVLRSQHPHDLEQEVWGILAVYQALIRVASDAAASRPDLDMDRLSFTVALHTARDQVTCAASALFTKPACLIGPIGQALLANLLPAHRRRRIKARSLKTTSKYAKNFGKHPRVTQKYSFHAHVMVMERGLPARPRP
ncbi:IS4 family transposase [Streptomyces synnematoformans]|uniref:IS4 family transposase n=1 Tax=Streptomyces synnematoformans TaxID=415721 RepID=A0ABP5J1N3_9ACTN